MTKKKIYVLDTNILLQSPNAIFGFADNHVVLTATTLQELDRKKSAPGELGFKAREAIRVIFSLAINASEKESLLTGITINKKGHSYGTFRIEPNGTSENYLPKGYSLEHPDNRIINTTISIKKSSKEPVILITNDISMRINALVCELEVQGYKNEQIEEESTYLGRREVEIPEKDMTQLFHEINLGFNNLQLEKYFTEDTLPEINEYITFISKDSDSLITCRYTPKKEFILIDKNASPMKIHARNLGQRMALDALMAPADEIPLVILRGNAGTAKTFLSLAAGLDAVLEGDYDRLMITRTNTLSDADIGFLPGSLEDKMGPLVAPFMDNLENLLKIDGEEPEQVKIQIEDMFETGIIEIASIAYMRGRSLTNTYLIVDEAQNSTVNQILEIITRAGEGTKIVLCGDPDQIDNSKLDRLNNGLNFAAERMRNCDLAAQLVFDKVTETVRSPLSKIGAERLTRK